MICNLNIKSFIAPNATFRTSQQCTSKLEDTFDLHLSVPQLDASPYLARVCEAKLISHCEALRDSSDK